MTIKQQAVVLRALKKQLKIESKEIVKAGSDPEIRNYHLGRADMIKAFFKLFSTARRNVWKEITPMQMDRIFKYYQ